MSVLNSGASHLCVLVISFNEIGDQGLIKLCKALHSPHCKLQELEYVFFNRAFLFLAEFE